MVWALNGIAELGAKQTSIVALRIAFNLPIGASVALSIPRRN
jgi:hypothetical protein